MEADTFELVLGAKIIAAANCKVERALRRAFAACIERRSTKDLTVPTFAPEIS
jgi:hypothetical protein